MDNLNEVITEFNDTKDCARILFTYHRNWIALCADQASIRVVQSGLPNEASPVFKAINTADDLVSLYEWVAGEDTGLSLDALVNRIEDLKEDEKKDYLACVRKYFSKQANRTPLKAFPLPDDQPTFYLNDPKSIASSLNYQNISSVGGIAFKEQDDYIDVIVHYSPQGYELWIDKVGIFVDENYLAYYIDDKVSKQKTIRLLSCSDIKSAILLSLALGKRPVIASNAPVKLYHDGTVEGGQWYKVTGNQVAPIKNPTQPTDETDTDRFVWLGGVDAIAETENLLDKLISRGIANKIAEDILLHVLYIDDVIGAKKMQSVIDELVSSPRCA